MCASGSANACVRAYECIFPFAKKGSKWQTQGGYKNAPQFHPETIELKMCYLWSTSEKKMWIGFAYEPFTHSFFDSLSLFHTCTLIHSLVYEHTEFPCACTHKNVNKYGSVRIQTMGKYNRRRVRKKNQQQ